MFRSPRVTQRLPSNEYFHTGGTIQVYGSNTCMDRASATDFLGARAIACNGSVNQRFDYYWF